jgi:A/G-specific adenine glycosylase
MVDTNVRRVLSRVFGVEPPAVDAIADSVVPVRAAYAWNQALMDLGATLCRTKRPLCLVCPLVAECGGPRPPGRARKPSVEFRATSRYVRGRVIDSLRGLAPGVSVAIDELAVGVDARQPDRVLRLIAVMAREGLVDLLPDNQVRLAE